MGIPEIQEIGKIITAAGGSAKEALIWYCAKDLLESLICTLSITGTIAYALWIAKWWIKRYFDDEASGNSSRGYCAVIARTLDGSSNLSSSDVEKICAIIIASRNK